jgi:hypothetical protein
MTEQPNVKPAAKPDTEPTAAKPEPKTESGTHRARTTAGFVSWETGIDDLVLTGEYQDVTADQAERLTSAAALQGVAVVITKKETEK